MPTSHEELTRSLRELYALRDFKPHTWTDTSDHAFLNITLIEQSIAQLAPKLTGEVLDVGCGQRPYATYFKHVTRMRGCDFNAARGPVDFECPADKIPLPDGSLDGILCTEVLEHVPDPLAVWREFYRLLKPGGRELLATPMYWPGHELPYDFFRYPATGLCHLARTAGFEVETLVPRGGQWAFLGQVAMHVAGHYLKFRWMRRLWNKFFLNLDKTRLNPSKTIGWTILARKT